MKLFTLKPESDWAYPRNIFVDFDELYKILSGITKPARSYKKLF